MSNRSLPEHFIIPVETLNREFDGKLLLALHAAARGLKPIIGDRRLINAAIPSLPLSIYLAKGIRTANRVMFSILDRLGHIIVALDEEALLPWPDEAMMAMYDEATFNRPRILFAWGERNAALWQRYPNYHGAPIVAAGNPRADMLRPEMREYYRPEVDALKARYGNYVLLSSNFSFVNHFIPNYVRFRTAVNSREADSVKTGVQAHKKMVFEAFKAAVPSIAKAMAPANLVIRPHPSENPAAWAEAAAGFDNVHIVHEGPIAPWLMAARALLHNGCTSAVEAAQLGLPAFAFMPAQSDKYDHKLPNALSQQVHSGRELAEAAADPLARPLSEQQEAALHAHIASTSGALSVDRILDSLQERRDSLIAGDMPDPLTRTGARANHLARTLARAVRSRIKSSRSSAAYLSHKFPGIAETEVNGRIARFRAVVPGLPDVRAREVRSGIFAIS